jgi:1,2-diacylglycerol 3-alpha-glucosyltransferase
MKIKMKILHICQTYYDNWGYQENLLPYYQSKIVDEVVVITSKGLNFNSLKINEYCLNNENEYSIKGVRIRRIKVRYNFINRFIIYKDLNKILHEENPDIIFHHGLSYLSLLTVNRYKSKNQTTKIIADTHSDYNNSGQNLLSKFLLHKFIYRLIIKQSLPNIEKIFYITPWCGDFANKYYRIPLEKMDSLYLGADIEKISLENKEEVRNKMRSKLSIAESDFVIVTAGKIDEKKYIHILLNAFSNICIKNIKVLIVGPIESRYEKVLRAISNEDERINYIGWVDSDELYNYFIAADLGIFPGGQSVLWQQAICCGLPLIVKKFPHCEYLDNGNILFLHTDSSSELKQYIMLLFNNKDFLSNMRQCALNFGMENFSYEKIAQKSISI